MILWKKSTLKDTFPEKVTKKFLNSKRINERFYKGIPARISETTIWSISVDIFEQNPRK